MPRTKEANELIKEMRRKDILRTALHLFCEKGYDAITMDDIAKACNISHGLIYHYFSKKFDILDSLFKESKEKFEALFGEFTFRKETGHAFFEKITDYILSAISLGEDYPYYICLFLSIRFSPYTYSQFSNASYFKNIEHQFEVAQKEGIYEEGNVKEYILCYLYLLKSIVDHSIKEKENHIIPSANVVLNILKRSNVND